MPFEGLARSTSLEHAAAEVERQRSRSESLSSRQPGFSPLDGAPSRPQRIAETSSEHSSDRTIDVEADVGVKEEKVPAPLEDEFLVTLKGREHLSPHSWGVKYRWFLTGFAGLLVLNASAFSYIECADGSVVDRLHAAFASSAPSNLIPAIIEDLHVSEEVGILLISIFVAALRLHSR
mgnify:FL=1